MCTTCGCGDPELVPVELHEKILAGNDRAARHNREHFVEAGVLALNLMGSPGAGKTAVLEATAKAAAAKGWRLGAVSADLATDHDARRLEKAGIPSRAITTGQACHLDAELVHRSLHDFAWRETDVFFIENVGNLVCPAIYDLGQAANVVVLSVTEGEDKPLKYPVMFKAADLVLLTKCDLVPHLDVDLAKVHDALARVMPRPEAIEVSARSGQGMDRWVAWLERLRARVAPGGARAAQPHTHPHAPARNDVTLKLELPEGMRKQGHAHDHDHGHGHGHDHGHGHRHGPGGHRHD
jgi:hydrogenase nickel incorporation protein HypB